MYIFQPRRFSLDEQIKKFSPYIKGKVLDVGAGSYSRYTDFFNFKEYVKMDILPGKNIDVVGRAESIPFGDETFDAIVCTGVLGDIKKPEQAILEFHRVLKRGGAVLLTESFMNELHDEPLDFWRFTEFSLEYLFKEAGFNIVSINRQGGFFSVMASSSIRYLISRFNLYSHAWAKIFSPCFKIYSKMMFVLDKIDKSEINKKFALGWCLLAKK